MKTNPTTLPKDGINNSTNLNVEEAKNGLSASPPQTKPQVSSAIVAKPPVPLPTADSIFFLILRH